MALKFPMGLALIPLGLTTFDTTDALASVAAGVTSTVRTVTGKGSAAVVLDGTGDAQVSIRVSVDGAADAVIANSNQAASVSFGFNVTLAIKAVNTDGVSAHNRCGISVTGAKQ